MLEIKNENGALLQYHNTDGISASMKFEGDATKLQVILDNLNQFSSADNA